MCVHLFNVQVFPLDCEHHEGRNRASCAHHYIPLNRLSTWQEHHQPEDYLLQNEFSLHRKDSEVGRDMMLVFRAD